MHQSVVGFQLTQSTSSMRSWRGPKLQPRTILALSRDRGGLQRTCMDTRSPPPTGTLLGSIARHTLRDSSGPVAPQTGPGSPNSFSPGPQNGTPCGQAVRRPNRRVLGRHGPVTAYHRPPGIQGQGNLTRDTQRQHAVWHTNGRPTTPSQDPPLLQASNRK